LSLIAQLCWHGLIAELDEKDKSIVFAIIDKMLTTKKFKDFFAKNLAMS
jgi:hypothetical protein